MSYHGIEIFFQNLGDADSIFIRHWENDRLTNILIDGGWKSSADQVTAFLKDRAKETGVATIHHLICSHAHGDHAGGLIELVERGEFSVSQAWVHDTRISHDTLSEYRAFMLKQAQATKVLSAVQEAEALRHELLEALEAGGVPTGSPFTGTWIGPLLVLGPSPEFFDQQFAKLEDEAFTRALNDRLVKRGISEMFDSQQTFEKQAAQEDQDKELGSDPSGPENEVSTVLALPWDDKGVEKIHLFTGDVGCEGLTAVTAAFGKYLTHVPWMQVPHHGSRRNMTQVLVDHFKPAMSFVSCDGSIKHPSRKLVNALKKSGKVYTTHYSVNSGSWLRHTMGQVPPLKTVPAAALYEKP